MKNLPKAAFISHGGGPLPLLGDPGHKEMVACLTDISEKIPKPDAVVVVSAHWEESIPTITSGRSPQLIYDYYGFPPESYEIRYPCVGSPSLSESVYRMLSNAGIESKLDDSRGFDHGLFVPLKIMYPDADVPCVQLSLVKSLDPATHIQIGCALKELALSGVLVIGSGFSFHNLKTFFVPEPPESRNLNGSFEAWLNDVCSNLAYSEEERKDRLIRWYEAEGARYCHPREEHLLPLHVCYGLAQGPSSETFSVNIMNKKSSMYVW